MRRSAGASSVDRRLNSRTIASWSVSPRMLQVLIAGLLGVCGIVSSAHTAFAQSSVTSWSTGRSAEIAVVLQGQPNALSQDVLTLSGAFRNNPDTSNFAVVPTAVDTSVIYIIPRTPSEHTLLDTVERIADSNSTTTSISVQGSGAADIRLQRSIEREALLAVGLVALVAGAILALLYSWQVGVGIAAILGMSAILATGLGTLFDTRFNGSVLSTNLPAVVASLVVVAMMGYHVTRTAPVSAASDDLRSTLDASVDVVRKLGRPVAFVGGQLILVWFVVELLFPSSNPVTSSLVGIVAGSIVGLFLVPLLVQMGGVSFDRPSQRLRNILREHEMAQTIGLGIVALCVLVTVVGVLNSFGRPTAGSLDQSALNTQSSAASVLRANGDLTEAVAVNVAAGADQESVDQFALEISTWPAVRLVQTSTLVALEGIGTDNNQVERERPFTALKTDDSQLVLVVPIGAERSNSTQQLVLDLQAQNILQDATVETERLRDVEFEARQGWLLVSVIFLTCLAGLIAALVVGGDLAVALSFLVVRLFLLLGVVGIGSSLITGGSVDEIILIVLAVAIILAWFEVSYWTYLEPGLSSRRSSAIPVNVSSNLRMRTPIRSSSVGLVALSAVGLTWMFADAPFLRPMGMALVVVPIVVTAAINVLLPSVFSYAHEFESSDMVGRNSTLKRPGLRLAMPSFDGLPFGRSRPVVVPRLRLLVPSKPSETVTRKPDQVEVEDGQSEPSVQEASSDVEEGQSEPSVQEAPSDLEEGRSSTELVDEQSSNADVEISVDGDEAHLEAKAEGTEAGVDDSLISEEPPVVIEGFSDLSVAGEGGFAVVYRAVDSSGNPVAIKVLNAVNDENERRRFDREKEALQTLADVDGVVELLGFGQTTAGAPYLALTYIEGGTIARRIRNRPYNWHEAYELGCQLAETLAICHRKGVFHRDLKPSNVLLADGDKPHLLDFGSTQIVDGRSLSTRAAFTPNYCPPEVLVVGNKGADSGLVDVYGLGILLWSMVAGRRPFVSDKSANEEMPMVFNRVATQKLEPLVGVPVWFKQIVEKAIEKNPSDRFGSVAEMHTALVTRSLLSDPETEQKDQNSSYGASLKRRIRNQPKIGFGDLFARRQPDMSDLFEEHKPTSANPVTGSATSVNAKPVQQTDHQTAPNNQPKVDWSAEASRLILADYHLASSPASHQVDEVYFPGTEVYDVASRVRNQYLELGHQIVGDQPIVLQVDVINDDAPIRLEVVVAHPPYVVLDRDGKKLQSCPFERRRSALWLVETDNGYRISTIVLRTSEQDET